MEFLDCDYYEICRKCNEDTNKYCVSCESLSKGYPICE